MFLVQRLARRRLHCQAPAPWRLVVTERDTRCEFRHLLRRLLREASYLPDRVARQYVHARIVKVFRKNHQPASVAPPPTRTDLLRARARQTCVLLGQANAGREAALHEVLQLAYGRRGPERERLLRPYVTPDAPTTSTELQAAIHARLAEPAAAADLAQDKLPLSTATRALAEAQILHAPFLSKGYVIRRIDPVIPKENIWGNPLPLKRRKNIKARAYRDLLQRILPPLSRDQWDRLRRLAMGEERWPGPLRRKAKGSHQPSTTSSYLPKKYQRGTVHDRILTERFMRRRYAALFVLCPTIRKHPEQDGSWVVTYGRPDQDIVPSATADDLAMYGILSKVPRDTEEQSPTRPERGSPNVQETEATRQTA